MIMAAAAAKERKPGKAGRSPAAVIRWLTLLGMAVALGVLGLGAAVLLDARKDAWQQAQQASANLAVALERDIARNIATYDLSLQSVIQALHLPGLAGASPEVRKLALFDRTAAAEYLGSMLVLDGEGRIREAAAPSVIPGLDLSDRDYFRIHRERADAGLYVSQPFRSRLRGGDPSIALSRRLEDPDGRFEGVVMGALRLAYFQDMFSRLDLGAKGSVTLLRTDGLVLARHPYQAADIGRDLAGTDSFRQITSAPSGHFVATAAIDGVRRLYSFHHVAGLPLVLNVAVSVDEVYAAWRRKAFGIGAILLLLCGATMALCLLFRREMLRRMAAEAALTEAAGRLAVMAATDGLTGLANRRQFDQNLEQEWRRAIRSGMPLALLLLDADQFKAYNDREGHQAGDQVLRRIAGAIRATVLRPADAGARYGGEEFSVLLPETEAEGAMIVAERIRAAVEALGIPHAGSASGQVTVSIGVAALHPQAGQDPALLVKAADAALYEAKHDGRNRACLARGAVAPAALPGVVVRTTE
jgi:diguanylate cyclase (GGDEF)-like protein